MTAVPPPFSTEELLAQLPALRGLARALVRRDEVEDLVAETVARAYERPPRNRRNVRAWLAATLRNLAVDQSRRRASQRGRRERLAGAASGVASGPDEALARAEALHQLQTELRELSAGDRRLLHLRFFEGQNATQIGQQLGLPASTVRGQLAAALERLRDRLRTRYGRDAFAPCLLLLRPWPPAAAAVVPSLTLFAMTKSMKISLSALLAVILAVCGMQFLPERTGGPGTDPELASLAERAGGERAPELPGVASTPWSAPAEPGQREPATTLAPEDGLLVTVLHAHSREPVPGAEVLVLDRDAERSEAYQAAHRDRLPITHDEERLTRKFGKQFWADENGQVVVPRLQRQFDFVIGATEEALGLAYTNAQTPSSIRELDVLIYPRIDVAVRVIDESGQGVEGVRVAYQQWAESGRATNHAFGQTDHKGRTVIRNIQQRVARSRSESISHRIVAELGKNELLSQEFEPEQVGAELIVLRMPPTVELRVHFEEEDWPESFYPGWPLGLVVAPRAPHEHPHFGTGAETSEWRTSVGIDGRLAVFPRVTPGFEGFLTLQIGGHREILWVPVSVPPAQADPLDVVFPAAPARAGFEVQLVDQSGQELEGAGWSGTAYELWEGQWPVHAHHTSGRGFHVDERASYCEAKPGERWYRITMQRRAERHRIQYCTTDVDVAGLDPDQRVVVLEYPDELLCSGVVVTPAGEPLPGVQVSARGSYRETGVEGHIMGSTATAWTDENGRFEVRGQPGVFSEIVLSLRGGQARPQYREGVADQRFVLSPKLEIRGALLLDPQIAPGWLWLQVERQDDLAPTRPVRPREDGSFTLGFLEPGLVRVVVRDAFQREVLASKWFTIEDWSPETPDQIRALDLRGLLHPHALQLSGPGASATGGLSLRELSTGEELSGGNPLRFASTQEAETVLVDPNGGAALAPVVIAGETELAVTEAIAVRVRLPDGIALSEEAGVWVLEARRPADSQLDQPLARAVFFPGEAELLLPAAGPWTFHLATQRSALEVLRPERRQQRAPVGGADWTFTIPADGLPEALTLPLRPETVAGWAKR